MKTGHSKSSKTLLPTNLHFHRHKSETSCSPRPPLIRSVWETKSWITLCWLQWSYQLIIGSAAEFKEFKLKAVTWHKLPCCWALWADPPWDRCCVRRRWSSDWEDGSCPGTRLCGLNWGSRPLDGAYIWGSHLWTAASSLWLKEHKDEAEQQWPDMHPGQSVWV